MGNDQLRTATEKYYIDFLRSEMTHFAVDMLAGFRYEDPSMRVGREKNENIIKESIGLEVVVKDMILKKEVEFYKYKLADGTVYLLENKANAKGIKGEKIILRGQNMSENQGLQRVFDILSFIGGSITEALVLADANILYKAGFNEAFARTNDRDALILDIQQAVVKTAQDLGRGNGREVIVLDAEDSIKKIPIDFKHYKELIAWCYQEISRITKIPLHKLGVPPSAGISFDQGQYQDKAYQDLLRSYRELCVIPLFKELEVIYALRINKTELMEDLSKLQSLGIDLLQNKELALALEEEIVVSAGYFDIKINEVYYGKPNESTSGEPTSDPSTSGDATGGESISSTRRTSPKKLPSGATKQPRKEAIKSEPISD